MVAVPPAQLLRLHDGDWVHGTEWSLDEEASSYLRIAAISIAAYDYLQTLPAEWRFYRSQRSWRVSPGCILFILIRYISLVTVVVCAVGYFARFTPEECQRWYMTTPVFKVLQIIVSQAIMGIRTINIARRNTWVLWIVAISFLVVTVLEFFTNLYDRNYVQDRRQNCTGGDSNSHLSVWLYYVVAMTYDFITLTLSMFFLMSYNTTNGRAIRLVRVMLYDGIWYFIMLTAVNILNLILYRTGDESTQSSGAALSFAVVWIMSQKILLHLRDAASEHTRTTTTRVVTSSRSQRSGRAVSAAMRTRLDDKRPAALGSGAHTLTASELQLASLEVVPWQERGDVGEGEDEGEETGVRVEVERSVTVEDEERGESSNASGYG